MTRIFADGAVKPLLSVVRFLSYKVFPECCADGVWLVLSSFSQLYPPQVWFFQNTTISIRREKRISLIISR